MATTCKLVLLAKVVARLDLLYEPDPKVPLLYDDEDILTRRAARGKSNLPKNRLSPLCLRIILDATALQDHQLDTADIQEEIEANFPGQFEILRSISPVTAGHRLRLRAILEPSTSVASGISLVVKNDLFPTRFWPQLELACARIHRSGVDPGTMRVDSYDEKQVLQSLKSFHFENKYCEGYLMKLDDLDVHGDVADRTWKTFYAELVGANLYLWVADESVPYWELRGDEKNKVAPVVISVSGCRFIGARTIGNRTFPADAFAVTLAGKDRHLFHFESQDSLHQWMVNIVMASQNDIAYRAPSAEPLLADKDRPLEKPSSSTFGMSKIDWTWRVPCFASTPDFEDIARKLNEWNWQATWSGPSVCGSTSLLAFDRYRAMVYDSNTRFLEIASFCQSCEKRRTLRSFVVSLPQTGVIGPCAACFAKIFSPCKACSIVFKSDELVSLSCKCCYCHRCFNGHFSKALTSENFPPRCCGTEIGVVQHSQHLDTAILELYVTTNDLLRDKIQLHCGSATCKHYIKPSLIEHHWGLCSKCYSVTCQQCRTLAKLHIGFQTEIEGRRCPQVHEAETVEQSQDGNEPEGNRQSITSDQLGSLQQLKDDQSTSPKPVRNRQSIRSKLLGANTPQKSANSSPQAPANKDNLEKKTSASGGLGDIPESKPRVDKFPSPYPPHQRERIIPLPPQPRTNSPPASIRSVSTVVDTGTSGTGPTGNRT